MGTNKQCAGPYLRGGPYGEEDGGKVPSGVANVGAWEADRRVAGVVGSIPEAPSHACILGEGVRCVFTSVGGDFWPGRVGGRHRMLGMVIVLPGTRRQNYICSVFNERWDSRRMGGNHDGQTRRCTQRRSHQSL